MKGITYKKAGVDINRADEFIKKIRPLISVTQRKEVIGGIGGFGGLFRIDLKNIMTLFLYRVPTVLVLNSRLHS